jgi:hypothetical protein
MKETSPRILQRFGEEGRARVMFPRNEVLE